MKFVGKAVLCACACLAGVFGALFFLRTETREAPQSLRFAELHDVPLKTATAVFFL